MDDLILKKDVLDKIKKSPELFSKIFGTDCLDTTVSYGLQLLNNNDPKLTQAKALRILKSHLGLTEDSELLMNVDNTVTA